LLLRQKDAVAIPIAEFYYFLINLDIMFFPFIVYLRKYTPDFKLEILILIKLALFFFSKRNSFPSVLNIPKSEIHVLFPKFTYNISTAGLGYMLMLLLIISSISVGPTILKVKLIFILVTLMLFLLYSVLR